MKKYIKLSEYAKLNSIVYKTAWNRFKAGKIPNAIKDEFGNVKVEIIDFNSSNSNRVAIYSRVSSNENKPNLISQSQRLQSYAIAKGYNITHIVEEVGSGVNDNRKKLQKLLQDNTWDILLVEHKDRLTRFGFNYIDTLIKNQNKTIEVVNTAKDETSDIVQDLVSIIYSFSAKMYGLRRSKRQTEKILECINQKENIND